MKYFSVKLSRVVEIPYEEGLIEGLINVNHLTYLANSKPKLIYENELTEVDYIDDKYKQDKKPLKIPLTIRDKRDSVDLQDIGKNKKSIYLNE